MPPRSPEADATDGAPLGSLSRILRNSSIQLASLGLFSLCTLVVVAILARALGKTAFGQYYYIFSAVIIVQMLLEFGACTLLTSRVAQHAATWRQTVAEAMGLMTLSAGVSLALFVAAGIVFAAYTGQRMTLLVLTLAGVTCAALHVQAFVAAVFRAFERFEFEALAKLTQGLALAALCFIFVRAAPGRLAVAVAALMVSHILAAVLLASCLEFQYRCLRVRLSVQTAMSWFVESVPLGIGIVCRSATFHSGTLILGLFVPAAAVGIYNLGLRPLGPLNWIPTMITAATFPSLARLASRQDGELSRRFATTARWLLVVSLPIAVTICLGAEQIVVILAGPDFRESAVAMQILIWVSVATFVSAQFRYLLTAVASQRLYSLLAIATLVLAILLELMLIPSWGFIGASVGYLVAECGFTMAGLAACRMLGYKSFELSRIWRVAIATAVMIAVLWPARNLSLLWFLSAALAATALDFAICVAIGVLPRTEIARLLAAARQMLGRRRRQEASSKVDAPSPGTAAER